jgi:hypothetical protein
MEAEMIFSECFPVNEKEKFQSIYRIMKKWKSEVAKSKTKFRSDGLKYTGDKWFSSDGFFPYYFSQKYKVLFVGREDRNDWNIVKEWMKILQKGELNNQNFFVPLLKILYGIENNFSIEYKKVPDINKIGKKIATNKGYSFAILELSKYGNENDDSGKNYDKILMKKFLDDSHLNKNEFFKDELSILDPDIIITMNIWAVSGMKKYIDKYIFENSTVLHSLKYAQLRAAKINDKHIPIIDTYHFSARGKNNENTQVKKYFYNPVMKMINTNKFKKLFPDYRK